MVLSGCWRHYGVSRDSGPERIMREFSSVRQLFCTLTMVVVIGVQVSVKIHRHVYQEKKKSLFYCLMMFKLFFKMGREFLYTSYSFCLVSPGLV